MVVAEGRVSVTESVLLMNGLGVCLGKVAKGAPLGV